jgi:hypothetical protein
LREPQVPSGHDAVWVSLLWSREKQFSLGGNRISGFHPVACPYTGRGIPTPRILIRQDIISVFWRWNVVVCNATDLGVREMFLAKGTSLCPCLQHIELERSFGLVVVHQRFDGTYRLHVRGRTVSQTGYQQAPASIYILKLSLWLTKHYTMKAYGAVDV